MPAPSDLDRVTMIVLRYLRGPFFTIVLVYAVGITGMALIPGQDADGNVEYMNLFHSFYFFTYTATTTGFGEIPNEFTDEQRLWAIFCLYTGVVAWFYAIGSTVRLLQNPHFIQAVHARGFSRLVRRIAEPFYIVCGFGDTGSLLARGLSDHHLGCVVIDRDPERIKALALRDYTVPMPGLCADASVPRHLVAAGVQNPHCRAVVILISDEDTVLKIAVVAKFLNPDVRIACRASSARHKEHLRELRGVDVIDPFEIFAQLLGIAIANPPLHNLNSWLVRAPGTRLGAPLAVPTGDWILCGYGRMGRWLHRYLQTDDFRLTVIDPELAEDAVPGRVLRAHADRNTLREAGIEQAAGIVACTDNDSDNLSILLSAQVLNPRACAITRQNDHANQLAFDAAEADLTLQASLTTARRTLKLLISPLIQHLIDHLRDEPPARTEALVARLRAVLGERAPHLWRVGLVPREATAAIELLAAGHELTLEALLLDPYGPARHLACLPLAIGRDGDTLMLPAGTTSLQRDDEIVFCGTERSESLLAATLNNPYTLHYLVTGTELARGWLFAWLQRRQARAA